MIDWIKEEWPVILFFGFLFLLLVGLGVGIHVSVTEKRRLIAQCMADGRKEYECEAFLKENTSMVIPVLMLGR